MSKKRPNELLSQNSVLGAFLSDPKDNTPEKLPELKPGKSGGEEKKKVSSNPEQTPKPKSRTVLKKQKPIPTVEVQDRKRVTYYMTPKQIKTLLRLIFEINSEQGVSTDKSRLVRAAINMMAKQNLDTIVKHLKNA